MLTDAGLVRLKKLIRKGTRIPKRISDGVEPRQQGDLEIDPDVLRDIRTLVKGSLPQGSQIAWELLFCVLKSANSVTRYLGLLIVEQLFVRSRSFRDALCNKIRDFMKQVIEIQGLSVLPPPDWAKVLLHQTGIRFIEEWEHKFGFEHKALTLAKRFLHSQLDHLGRVLDGHQVRRERELAARELRATRLLQAQFETVRNEMSRMQSNYLPDMERNLSQINESLELLSEQVKKVREEDSSTQKSSSSSSSSLLSSLPPQHQQHIDHKRAGDENDDDDDDDDDFDFDIDWSAVKIGDSEKQPVNRNNKNHADEDEEIDDDIAEWEALEHHRTEEAKIDQVVAHLPDDFKVTIERKSDKQIEMECAKRVLGDPTFEPIVDSIREGLLESTRSHLPIVNRWIRILTQVELTESITESQRSELLRQALSLKNEILRSRNRTHDFGLDITNACLKVSVDNNQRDFIGELESGTIVETKQIDETTTAQHDKKRKKKKNKKEKKKAKTTSKKKRKLDPFGAFSQ